MNILIISQYFWPENFRINDLAIGLLEYGHQVTVLTGIPNYPQGSFFAGYGLFKNRVQDYRGIKVIRSFLLPRGKSGRIGLALNYLSFALCASVVAVLLCRKKYDLVFVYEPSPVTVGLPALIFKKLKDVPIMFWVQDLWPESLSAIGAVHSKSILKNVERFTRFIYRGCDRILVQSQAFVDPIRRLGISSERLVYFPNSAEELYRPVEVEENAPERALLPSGFRIMFAGNIGAAQDFGTILDAAEILKSYSDIQWIILGDGRLHGWVAHQIKKRALTKTVHLLGRHPAEAMPRYFALADVLLVTLKKEPIFSLTIPSKVQSYLACAKPVVAALEGEGARVVEEAGAGFACPAENSRLLADAVLGMYRLPQQERYAMGVRGRVYFEENFERTLFLNRLNELMKELARES